MRLFENAHYPFIRLRFIGYALSGAMILLAIAGMAVRGLQYGIDFKGGTELVISFEEPVPVAEAREILAAAMGSEPQVRAYGSDRELQVRTESDLESDVLTRQVIEAFNRVYPGNSAEVVKVDLIGPSFARDIRSAALNATLFSILVIGVYIFLRFHELSFMVAVIVTLVHDTVIIVGVLTLLNGLLLFNMDLDQNLIAALLTIIGYSLNDTIVVFDRVRENQHLHKGMPMPELVNSSINQTLSRTVVTSLTTFLVVVILFLFGGESLKGFSFALTLGIVLGTYSTIFFACPMVVDLPNLLRKRKEKSIRKVLTTFHTNKVPTRNTQIPY